MRIPMRRKERETSKEEALAALDRAPCGILSVIDDKGEPYCVPLSLARDGDWLYFHCALEGYKIKNLREKQKVCVAFVATAEFPEDQFTVMYESAIVFGAAEEVTDDDQKLYGLRLISQRFTPKLMHTFDEYAGRMVAKTGVWKIHIDEITGKRRKKP